MTRKELRDALLDRPDVAKEIRTNDGRTFRVVGVESWALGVDEIVVLGSPGFNTLSIRTIASIGRPSGRGRRGPRRRAL